MKVEKVRPKGTKWTLGVRSYQSPLTEPVLAGRIEATLQLYFQSAKLFQRKNCFRFGNPAVEFWLVVKDHPDVGASAGPPLQLLQRCRGLCVYWAQQIDVGEPERWKQSPLITCICRECKFWQQEHPRAFTKRKGVRCEKCGSEVDVVAEDLPLITWEYVRLKYEPTAVQKPGGAVAEFAS